MNARPQYNLMDMVFAPARALSAKQILLMTMSLVGGLLVFDLFRYLAYLEQGENLGLIFSIYDFFPIDFPSRSGLLSQILCSIGIAGGVFCVMLGLFAVSAIHVEAIRGNPFLSLGQTIKFARSRARQILYSELAVIVFVLFIILLMALFGLLTRIPVLGELLFAVFFVIPNFIIALFAVFIIFVLGLSVLLLPAVAAAERHGESFGVILETFSTIIRQPARWLGYTVFAGALSKICSFVYAYFAFRAVQFLVWSTAIGGGDQVERLVRSGLAYLPTDSRFVYETLNVFPRVPFSISVGRWAGMADNGIAGHLMAVMLLLIFASILGYLLSVLAAAQVYTYVNIRKSKDGHDLADEKSLFFEDEHVNPEIVPSDEEAGRPSQN
jgi:hypothetical protein